MSTGRENVTGKRHSRDAQDPECHGYVHMFQGENDEIESSKLRKLCLLGIHTKQVLFCFVFTSQIFQGIIEARDLVKFGGRAYVSTDSENIQTFHS